MITYNNDRDQTFSLQWLLLEEGLCLTYDLGAIKLDQAGDWKWVETSLGGARYDGLGSG